MTIGGDHCSHGKVELTMAGPVLTVDGDEFGIIESALALLRTLDTDYDPDRDRDGELSSGLLLLHGCGTWPMVSCPVGISWRVEHTDSEVHISEVKPDIDQAEEAMLAIAAGDVDEPWTAN